MRELNWPSPAAEAEWRAGLRPGIPVGGRVAAWQAAVSRAWATWGKVTRDRKLDRVPVDPSTALVCDDLDEHGNEDEIQGPSLQGVARMLEDMEISPSLT